MICRSIPVPASAPEASSIRLNDGSDWTLGTPSKLGQLPHDGGMGFDGNLYYTVNNPNRVVTVGKVDTKTGEVKYLKVDRRDGTVRRRPPTASPATATATSGSTSIRAAAASASSKPRPRRSASTRRRRRCRRSAAP